MNADFSKIAQYAYFEELEKVAAEATQATQENTTGVLRANYTPKKKIETFNDNKNALKFKSSAPPGSAQRIEDRTAYNANNAHIDRNADVGYNREQRAKTNFGTNIEKSKIPKTSYKGKNTVLSNLSLDRKADNSFVGRKIGLLGSAYDNTAKMFGKKYGLVKSNLRALTNWRDQFKTNSHAKSRAYANE